MRYQVRWSNGFWKTFDSYAFVDIERHATAKDAEAAVAAMNVRLARVAEKRQ